jgi:hypothetical protein
MAPRQAAGAGEDPDRVIPTNPAFYQSRCAKLCTEETVQEM